MYSPMKHCLLDMSDYYFGGRLMGCLISSGAKTPNVRLASSMTAVVSLSSRFILLSPGNKTTTMLTTLFDQQHHVQM
jgi:hypothetical protein